MKIRTETLLPNPIRWADLCPGDLFAVNTIEPRNIRMKIHNDQYVNLSHGLVCDKTSLSHVKIYHVEGELIIER